jgi:hypothetical protein
MFELLVWKRWCYCRHIIHYDFTTDMDVGLLSTLFIAIRSLSHTEIMDVSTLLHNCFQRERHTYCDLISFLCNCSIYHDLSLMRSQPLSMCNGSGSGGFRIRKIVIVAASGHIYPLQDAWTVTVAIGSVKEAKLV